MFSACLSSSKIKSFKAFFILKLSILQPTSFIIKKNHLKRLFTLALKLFFGFAFTTVSVAQNNIDYTIQLKFGEFIPQKNSSTLTKDNEVFAKSLFGNTHYLTIQFNQLPTESEKNKLKEAGIFLVDYIPNMCFTAAVNQNFDINVFKQFNIRSVFQLSSIQKTIPDLLKEIVPTYAVKQIGFADVTIITYEKISINKVEAAIQNTGSSIIKNAPMFKSLVLRVPINKLSQIIAMPFIQWVEPIDPPDELENTLGRTLHRANILNDGIRNLKGEGINIGEWDGGEVSPHLDFSPAGRLTLVETSSASDHSTHVAGIMAGRGLIDPKGRGMAPNAKLFSYDFNGDIQIEMDTAIPNHTLSVSNHSYGGSATCGLSGSGVTYASRSRSTDINLNNYNYHLHVHSSGNSQSSCTGGWSTITGSGKPAKNSLLVANITTTEVMSSSSSFGPVQDGRVKPEISAFGTSVFSTYIPLNSYGTISGTSMATPGVTGTAALLYQRYKQLNSNNLPPSTLIKNIIMNAAFDLGNPGPDYKFGYGRINSLEAVKILETNRYILNSISTGATNTTNITIPANAAKLRVMVTWNDPAGTANANPCLVNDLNLTVVNGSTTYLPWVLDKNNPGTNATKGVDAVSNIEQVEIDNPVAGNYAVNINGFAVPSGPQLYALTWIVDMPYIEVTYPNGNETLNPGSSETITWNNAGVTSAQTVEYSLDNGATWTNISVVGFNTTRLAWTIPSGLNTSTAKIRVSTLDLSDVSDAGFKILSTPTGFYGSNTGCNPGEVVLNWNYVSTATNYDVYRLNTTTGYFDIIATNVSTNSYTVSGLAPSTGYWFTIRAKNSSTFAESERAIAINVTSSVGNLPPQTFVTPNSFSQCNDSPAKALNASGGTGSFTWSPQVGLYTDQTGFFVYTGDNRSVVYAKPSVTTKYSAFSTNTSSGCYSQDTANIIVNCSLPVSIINFSGSKGNGVNNLNWSTSTEQNNKGFELEKSIDGLSFSKIGFINSKADNGYSSSILNYSFVDDKLNSSSNYYRLKQIDQDGKSKYSNVILLKGDKISNVKMTALYPNPATDEITVSIDAPSNEKIVLMVTDIYGKQLMTNKITVESGTNISTLKVNHLASGTYFVKMIVENKTETSVIKFVKTK